MWHGLHTVPKGEVAKADAMSYLSPHAAVPDKTLLKLSIKKQGPAAAAASFENKNNQGLNAFSEGTFRLNFTRLQSNAFGF